MTKRKDIPALLLSGLFLFGFIMVIYLFGNWLFCAIGIGLMLPFLMYIFSIIQSAKHAKLEENRRIEQLKATGEKIMLDLAQFDIMATSWTEETLSAPKRIVAIDRLVGQADRHIKTTERHANQLTYNLTINGENYTFISDVLMEPSSLKMHFAIQKHTYFYYDKNDLSNYYLDLEFLK